MSSGHHFLAHDELVGYLSRLRDVASSSILP